MRRFISFCCLCCAAVLTSCSKPDSRATDTAAVAPAATSGAGATISLGEVAGRWNARSVPESGDSTPTMFVLNATNDTNGWSITFPNRQPIATRVLAVDGDSIVTETGPYESARRKGVQVTTRVVWRRDGDRLVGRTVAHYQTSGPDSVLILRSEATRVP